MYSAPLFVFVDTAAAAATLPRTCRIRRPLPLETTVSAKCIESGEKSSLARMLTLGQAVFNVGQLYVQKPRYSLQYFSFVLLLMPLHFINIELSLCLRTLMEKLPFHHVRNFFSVQFSLYVGRIGDVIVMVYGQFRHLVRGTYTLRHEMSSQ